jgi:hypothetical protein
MKQNGALDPRRWQPRTLLRDDLDVSPSLFDNPSSALRGTSERRPSTRQTTAGTEGVYGFGGRRSDRWSSLKQHGDRGDRPVNSGGIAGSKPPASMRDARAAKGNL